MGYQAFCAAHSKQRGGAPGIISTALNACGQILKRRRAGARRSSRGPGAAKPRTCAQARAAAEGNKATHQGGGGGAARRGAPVEGPADRPARTQQASE